MNKMIILNDDEKNKIINTYIKVSKGRQRWPIGYWDGDTGKTRAIICTRYALSEILEWSNYDIGNKLNKSLFNKKKLSNMLKRIFNEDIYEAVLCAFPEKEDIIRDLIEKRNLIKEIEDNQERLMIDKEYRRSILVKILKIKGYKCLDDLPKISKYDLSTYGLFNMFSELYNEDFLSMAEDLFPSTFFAWDFFSHSTSYKEILDFWGDKSNRNAAFKWLTSSMCQDNIDIKELTLEYFENLSLETLLDYYEYKKRKFYTRTGKHSREIHPLFEEFVPGEVMPWQLNEEGSNEYWKNNYKASQNAFYHILKKKNINEDNANLLVYNDFKELNLSKMLNVTFEGSVYNFVNNMIPNKFVVWDFKEIPSDLWFNDSFRREGLLNLLRENGIDYKSLSDKKDEIADILSRYNFKESKYDRLLSYYKGSLVSMLNSIFPDIFKDCNFKDLERKYEDLFGPHEELELVNYNKKENMWYIDSDELNKIFTPNPNAWSSYSYSFDKIYNNSKEHNLIEMLRDKKISIYKYNLEEPNEPENELEEDAFEILCNYSKARNMNVCWLYWRAYNFFKDKGYYLTYPRNTVYMGLSNKNTIYNQSYRFRHKSENSNDTIINKTISEELDKDVNTTVRCGEMDLDRLQLELYNGSDYIWIFPFVYMSDEEIKGDKKPEINAYLIKSNTDFEYEKMSMMSSLARKINGGLNI